MFFGGGKVVEGRKNKLTTPTYRYRFECKIEISVINIF
jgi:hypothetical protein